MFWGDKIVKNIKEELESKISSGETLIIRDEKTASGRVHVGSMRGVAIHGIISDLLDGVDISNRFLYEINDFDLYNIVQGDNYNPHFVEINITGKGFKISSFTFG